jgi:hypothetical protein
MSRLYRARVPVLYIVGIFVLATVVTGGLAWWFQRPVLRIAVEGQPSLPATIMSRFAEASRRDGGGVQIESVTVRDSVERLRQSEARMVEAAVFRLDELLPRDASAIALIGGEVVLAAARQGARVTKFQELGGKRIGVAAAHAADHAFVTQLVESYRIDGATLIAFSADEEARDAFANGRIDAVVLMDRPDSPRVRAFFADLGQGANAPVLLSVEASVARARQPHVESATVPAAVVDPRRTLPAEELTTIGLKRVVLVSNELSRGTVWSLARFLFERRDQLAASTPAVVALQPPSTDRGSSIPVHPGASDYVDATEMTFLTRYSDFIYMSLCFSGVFGSLWAALHTRYRFSERHGLTALIAGLAEVGQRAAVVTETDELTGLEREAADRVLSAVQNPRYAADPQAMGVLQFTFAAAQVAIEARRRELMRDGLPPGRRTLNLVRPG